MIAARWTMALAIYLLCAILTGLIIRDGLDHVANGRPVRVAIWASIPWWFGVPAMLALFGIIGP